MQKSFTIKTIARVVVIACLVGVPNTVCRAMPLLVGMDQAGNSRFTGTIASIRIFPRALSDAQVAALAATKPQASPAPPADTEIDYQGDYSLAAWVQASGNGTLDGRVLDQVTPGGSNGFLFDFHAGHLRSISGSLLACYPLTGKPDAWIHIATVVESGVPQLFVDGKPVTTRPRQTGPGIFGSNDPAPAAQTTLWWKQPAKAWYESVPLGNGRTGVMVDGGVDHETLWLNDDTLTAGEPRQSPDIGAVKALPALRQLLFERKDGQANGLFDAKMLGLNTQSYLPLGTLDIAWPTIERTENYRRTLDILTGLFTVTYRQNGVNFKRELFASYPDHVVVMRLTADQPGKVSFSTGLTSLLRYKSTAQGRMVKMIGRAPSFANESSKTVYDEGENPKGMTFEADVQAFADGGSVSAQDGRLVASDCDAVTLILVEATSYNGFDKSPSRDGLDPGKLCGDIWNHIGDHPDVNQLQARSTQDVRSLMNRVHIDVPHTPKADRPTDHRINGGFASEDLPALTALYYQFGRYLLVCCSRPGSQPSNLQGMWNHEVKPPWNSNYTMNCNAEWNYLGVEAANLSELHEPFIRLVKEWSVDGRRVAKLWYGVGGWVGHHNTDLWRMACPTQGSAKWAAFTSGSGWVCQDLWEHYAFTNDTQYLRDVWPTLKGAAEFYLEFLVEDPKTKYLVSAPDTNFENPNTRSNGVCMGSTPSNMIIRQLFTNCIAATKILGGEDDFRGRLQKAVVRLAPTRIDPSNGELQEYLDDGDEVSDPGLGELLSTWGLIWCDQLTPRTTPDLCAAVRRAYENPVRRPWVTGSVGSWRTAFPLNTFARLDDGDRSAEILITHFRTIVHPSLICGFIQSEWQIDGNLGVMAGIGEMFMQSQTGEIELLPALPKSLPTGKVTGLRARGGFTVDIEWKDGKVVSYRIASALPQQVKIRVNGEEKTVTSQVL